MGTDSTAGGEDWEVLRRFLPAGWEEEARRSGALRRAPGVDWAESLLRVSRLLAVPKRQPKRQGLSLRLCSLPACLW